ncbi:hypothetical protein CPB83DRAFT_842838 [Crepidotus variabilis]|uniref:Uncharacterized protein n=1 Tax=Crepidotus variabilis TaxID=179855 RepID=A0A9P6EU55_9AGAR|nr:hypothetical protein CPB83DRAFT_842838 [Crepidotus variabilis]
MKIEWASNFRSDGTRRRPPPSSMHGWLAKMRGTLLGNESLRSRGMREMREAQSRRQHTSTKRRQHSSKSGGSIFSFLKFGKSSKHGAKLQSKRPTGSSRPSYRSTHSHGSRPARPPLRPNGSGHKSSHRSTRQDASRPHNTRRSTRR